MRTGGSLHSIHGFLGKSEDWMSLYSSGYSSEFFSRLPSFLSAGMQSELYDLFQPMNDVPLSFDLTELGRWVNRRALATSSPRILMGYSLGGRIALHALKESPEIWSGAVLISTHPGLSSSQEKETRIKSDNDWASRFLNDSWDKLIQDWNSQPVFQNGKEPLVRVESEFSRIKLAKALMESSLGKQVNFRPYLKDLKVPILWISGAEDVKFRAIAEEVVGLNSICQAICIPESGHRAPWDHPAAFCQALTNYLARFGAFEGVNSEQS